MQFRKAVRARVPLRIAITGPTGSGKTYSALRLAAGLGARIAVIDTENGSASLYADIGRDGIPAYDVLEVTPPFAPEQCERAVRAAVDGGYDVVIIDSLSHFWAGEGGLLERKDALDQRKVGKSFQNWAEISKQYERLKGYFLHAPIDVIATMRSKMEYVVEETGQGGKSIRKVGLAPVMRDGIEYDFTIVLDVDMSHCAVASKDRTGLFTDLIGIITQKHGGLLTAWRSSGAEWEPPAPEPEPAPEPTPEPAPKPAPASNGSGPKPTRADALSAGKLERKARDLFAQHWGAGMPDDRLIFFANALLDSTGRKAGHDGFALWTGSHWFHIQTLMLDHIKSCGERDCPVAAAAEAAYKSARRTAPAPEPEYAEDPFDDSDVPADDGECPFEPDPLAALRQ